MILSLDGLKLQGQCQACWGVCQTRYNAPDRFKATEAAFDAVDVEKCCKIWVKEICVVKQSDY